MKSLSIKQRTFLETGLLPYTTELGYANTIHIIHRVLDLDAYEVWEGFYLNFIVDEYKLWMVTPNSKKEQTKPLTQKQREFLENHLIPFTQSITHRAKDFTSAIQKVMREGEYTLKQKFMLQRLWRIWRGNEK